MEGGLCLLLSWGDKIKTELHEFNVKLDNCFFEDCVDDKNKIDELVTYYLLSRMVMDLGKEIIISNIGLLADLIILGKKNNTQSVQAAIDGLCKKGFLELRILDSEQKKDYLKPIEISLLKISPARYTSLQHWMFEKSDDKKEFFVYAYIEKWKNHERHKISLNEWASQMGYTVNGVDMLLKRLGSKGRIQIVSGKYYYDENLKKYKQDTNDYKVTDEDGETYKTVDGDYTLKDILDVCDGSNWGKKDQFNVPVKLAFDDYKIYRICKDLKVNKKFVIRCERSMENMSRDKIIEWEKEYDDHLRRL